MKHTFTTALFLLSFTLSFSQNLFYQVRAVETRGVSKEKLDSAKTISDIRPGYSSAETDDYLFTTIAVTGNGKVMKASSSNGALNDEQQNLLHRADVGSEIIMDIGYVDLGRGVGIPDVRTTQLKSSVVPETEAEYPGGNQELTNYLEEKAIHKISSTLAKEMKGVIITFTVTEAGEITNAQISESSEDPEIDKILLDVINKMPRWDPAKNAEGMKVSQEFIFTVGNIGC